MAHERETVVLSPAAAACPPSGALLAHSKRLAWLVACFMEVELRLFINLHAQTPLDSCSVEVAQKIMPNRWAHLNVIGCRGGNSGDCVTVSVIIGLSTNPCCSPGQSKHRPLMFIYFSASRRLISVCTIQTLSPFLQKNWHIICHINLILHNSLFFLPCVFALCRILHNIFSRKSPFLFFSPHPLTHFS